jgi:hypothetical protein
MSLERDLIVFSRVTVELSRIEQWKISADHGFFSNNPPGAGAAVAKRPRAGRRCGALIREPPLIVSAQLREPKSVADLFLVPSYSPTHRL